MIACGVARSYMLDRPLYRGPRRRNKLHADRTAFRTSQPASWCVKFVRGIFDAFEELTRFGWACMSARNAKIQTSRSRLSA